MTKTYRSRCNASFTLKVGKTYRRFSFDRLSYGGSSYTTSDEAEQKALENSPYFGKSFFIESIQQEQETEKEAPKAALAVVEVNDIEEAREYLMNNYGYSGSSLRSKKAILDAAQEKNIEFTGI